MCYQFTNSPIHQIFSIFSIMKRLFLPFLLLFFSTVIALADSPLTSTEFWRTLNPTDNKADNPPVLQVYDESGWGDDVLAVLCSPDVPVEQRLCLVNYVGWNFSGQKHYADFVTFYVEKNNIESKQKVYDGMSGEQMIIFAYVKAMDDYFDVRQAERIAKEAVKRSPNSRAVNMIFALITAQHLFDYDWGGVYKVCHKVEVNNSLNNDFSDNSVKIIMEYIGLYQDN